MGNPKPDLQGFADPEDPNWEENLKEMVRIRQRRTHRHRDRYHVTPLPHDPPFRARLNEAADKRGINISGYIRRATAAMIAYDLGISLAEACEGLSFPLPQGQNHLRILGRVEDDGSGYGSWVIPPATMSPTDEIVGKKQEYDNRRQRAAGD